MNLLVTMPRDGTADTVTVPSSRRRIRRLQLAMQAHTQRNSEFVPHAYEDKLLYMIDLRSILPVERAARRRCPCLQVLAIAEFGGAWLQAGNAHATTGEPTTPNH